MLFNLKGSHAATYLADKWRREIVREEKDMNLVTVSILGGVVVIGLVVAAIALINKYAN